MNKTAQHTPRFAALVLSGLWPTDRSPDHSPIVTLASFNPEALVQALVDTFGLEHAFASREVVDFAERNPDSPLAIAIGGRKALRLGKAFEKIAGWNLSGFRLERIDEERNVAVWWVVRA